MQCVATGDIGGVHFSPIKVCEGYEYYGPDCPESKCGADEVED